MSNETCAEFVGQVVATPEGHQVEALFGDSAARVPAPLEFELGSIVHVQRQAEAWAFEPLAPPAGALRELYGVLAKYQLNPVFPAAVMAETRNWLQAPGLDDPALIDLTSLPFVTIDGATSRDLDQAVYVSEGAAGLVVQYAIADASYYVPTDSELWREAAKRAASYYLPGLMVPMLPRELSEGLISLNPKVDRRSLVFETTLRNDGTLVSTTVTRAKIRSSAKLSFESVQAFYETGSGIESPAIRQSLELLKRAGELRMTDAEERDVVRYRRGELQASIGSRTLRFVTTEAVRRAVESYNEQLSLMCNSEGARLLRENSNLPFVEPIYRVHPPPTRERLDELRELITNLTRSHNLDTEPFTWKPERSLSDYLRELPENGAHGRLSKAIHRQAVMVNVRSSYQNAPGAHFGVGATVYARFSAPMREVVGVFLHAELIQALRGQGSLDKQLSHRVIESANRAKQVQRQLTNEANLLVLNQLFTEQLSLPGSTQGLPATVMGMTASKLYVEFDSPPIDAKIRLRDIKNHHQSDGIRVKEDGCCLVSAEGRPICRVGDQVTVVVLAWDEKRARWALSIR